MRAAPSPQQDQLQCSLLTFSILRSLMSWSEEVLDVSAVCCLLAAVAEPPSLHQWALAGCISAPIRAVISGRRQHGYARGFGRCDWHTFVRYVGSLDMLLYCAVVCCGAGEAQLQGSKRPSAGTAFLATCRERRISCCSAHRHRRSLLLT